MELRRGGGGAWARLSGGEGEEAGEGVAGDGGEDGANWANVGNGVHIFKNLKFRI